MARPRIAIVDTGSGNLRSVEKALAVAGAEGGEEGRRGIVHRLDRDTSGLLVVARSPEAYERLQRLVRRRDLTREYLALVVGRPRSRRGTIEAPLGRDRRDPLRQSLDTDTPRSAVTHFEVEELLEHHALLRVRLETGRTHQIRVHLAAIDLPVAGDPVYGVRGELGLERQFLHAARLAFVHPVTGTHVDVSSPLPADLAAADKVVLPGQGAFGAYVAGLGRDGGALRQAVLAAIRAGKPYLGICMGLQLLFGSSEEEPGCAGLGVLPGKVVRFKIAKPLKVPHMGWNACRRPEGAAQAAMLDGTSDGTYFYFVHSYYPVPERASDVALVCEHGETFCSAVAHDNIFASQFHPEKSQRAGLALLSRFVSL